MMRAARVVIAPALLCSACAAAYSGAPAGGSAGPPAAVRAMQASEVELDIFSGRPNPAWTLSDAETRGLAERLAALPPAGPSELHARLGYRGLIVTLHQPDGEARARFQHGIAEIAAGGRTAYYEDRDRALERWLVATGEAHMPAEIRQLIDREFD